MLLSYLIHKKIKNRYWIINYEICKMKCCLVFFILIILKSTENGSCENQTCTKGCFLTVITYFKKFELCIVFAM